MRRLPSAVELVLGLLLIAHAILAFTKWRWVTGLLEVIAGVALALASRAPATVVTAVPRSTAPADARPI